MKIAILILGILMMTANVSAQTVSLKEVQSYLDEFKRNFEIPRDYQFQSVNKVNVDDIPAYLFRFEKSTNKGLKGEHYSFVISEKDKQMLGFTNMDKKYSNINMLSKSETEKIAKDFLLNLDRSLANGLKNIWIEGHDEEILVNGVKTTITGMKYKCYCASQNNYAWVIVGFDGSIITFERNIKWNNSEHKRTTEKWLHDSWLAEANLNMSIEEQILRKLTEETFANGALNKLNVEKMLKGFHSDFAILIPKENSLFRLSLRDWMKVVEEYKNNPEKIKSGIRTLDYMIEILEITGHTAVVKTQFFREGKLIITDYLSYIKYPEGWKAVAKISNEHIVNPLQLNL
ncbi:nuclear transport factor 2 family protein [Chryseobacterium sp. R2ACT005]|uniref:nuclear transport factor 2 family protein n=1 Tax=Chryseobacterium sp. R2ACT005 TaxID=3416668 RepID=UPI003CF605E8